MALTWIHPSPTHVVRSGWLPGKWSFAAAAVMITCACARLFAWRSFGDSHFYPYVIVAVASMSTLMSGLLVRSVFVAAGDVSISLVLFTDIWQEFSTMLLCRISTLVARQIEHGCPNQRTTEPGFWKTKFVCATMIGVVDVLGSLAKSLAIVGISISGIIAMRGFAVPMSLIVRSLGLGRSGHMGYLAPLLLTFGSGMLGAGEVLDSKTRGKVRSHIHLEYSTTAELDLGLALTPIICTCLMLVSVACGVIQGQIKEWLIHRKVIDGIEVQEMASSASFAISVLGFCLAICIHGIPAWTAWTPLTLMFIPLVLSSICKGFDQIVGTQIVGIKDYTWKKAIDMVKFGPVYMFELGMYYFTGDSNVGRAWEQSSLLIVLGFVAVIAGLLVIPPVHKKAKDKAQMEGEGTKEKQRDLATTTVSGATSDDANGDIQTVDVNR